MYREMEEAGLPKPEYKTVAFMVHATIKNKKYIVDVASAIACDLLGVKERRTRSVLVDMCKMGYLKKQGATSNLKYILDKE